MFDFLIDWLAHGLLHFQWWQVLIYVLVTTHITIASVTIFLHRHQAHRALDLHPIISHFFRFWLWIGTGMVTKEWAAIHRKHHAKCEVVGDPHSPHVAGLNKVLWDGVGLYRVEARNQETMDRYGQGTPDDWMERNVYSAHSALGVVLMLIANLVMFGALGLTVWAIQMAWIPFWAAGVVNGLGHFWGYRNFEANDASTNLSPIGIIIGGEEMHNNHHTYPTSAKFSTKWYEFDIGWTYIRVLSALGLAKVKKTAPQLELGDAIKPADDKTLEALIAHRYEIMADYAHGMRQAFGQEVSNLKARVSDSAVIKSAARWLHRDAERAPASAAPQLAQARAASPVLDKMVTMREELRRLWLDTSKSREELVASLRDWIDRAEKSGIAALQDFSRKLRRVHA